MGIKKQEVGNAIENKLGLKPKAGKENNVKYFIDGKFILRITYPKGRGDLKLNTLKNIVKQSKLCWDDFIDLIKCPLSASDFEKIIRNKIRNRLL
ncbi:hypothetical protein ISS30_08660 [bacterium]|nr:hypothetical protein [FCB group bacterium]MBL7191754.1 hypothetical protein [bacterium]